MLKRWATWPPRIRWLVGVAAVVLALAIVWALLVPVADWIARHDISSSKGSLLPTARDAARGRLLTLGAGLVAAGALLFTARTFTLAREGQVTDRYTKAIEQLGSDKLDVRIGGIYALERVAHDSAKDHPTVMEVLTAFIREHSHEPWPPDYAVRQDEGRSTRPDVQAAVTVVGRRNAKRDIRPVDLTRADLTRADLTDADLTRANLAHTTLTRATLTNANLTDAGLAFAKLGSAKLDGAHLTSADLVHSDLARATLTGADLARGDLAHATLTRANLTRANLRGAYLPYAAFDDAHLTSADLTAANIHDATLDGAILTGATFTAAILTRAKWPVDAPVPEGWKLDTVSGCLERAGL